MPQAPPWARGARPAGLHLLGPSEAGARGTVAVRRPRDGSSSEARGRPTRGVEARFCEERAKTGLMAVLAAGFSPWRRGRGTAGGASPSPLHPFTPSPLHPLTAAGTAATPPAPPGR